ncbi:MAG: PD-(D/E)XK nuclease family protein, partial [Campylobacterota bacterium]|nr:PD-(D/E)XK nuclease family protein [Campylobacterota bacterium]
SGYEFKIISDISKIVNCNIEISFNQFNLKNLNLFDTIKDDLKSNYRYIIDITNDKIIKETKDISIQQDITISPISSQLEQIAFIKYKITTMIQSGIDADKIVVITPNEQITKMLELFDKEHYFNFAMGRTIKDNKIFQVIKLINKILIDKEPKDNHKFKFLQIEDDKFINLFKNNWKSVITYELFNDITNYLFSFEHDEEVLEKLEVQKTTLELLLFVNLKSDFENILVKDFIKLLQNQISSITVDDVFGGKITVLGILETRLVSYDGVIVIDFNDDKIPKISVKDKFISSSLKSKANLPTIENRENLQRYYYSRVFSKASNIALCYIDDDSSVMSRFIVQLFPNYKELIVKSDYKSILYNNRVLTHFYKDIILDIDLSKLSWSATSLKSYLTCKKQYYFNYIANIKDHSISIKPLGFEVGNIIHNALENGVKQNSLNTQFINQYLSSYQKTNPYLVLELELWKKKLTSLVEFEKIREQEGIVISEVEKPFNLNYKTINLKGKIDRVDIYPDNSYEILDYKTSSSLKIDTLKSYEDSTDFQLEFYQIASRDKNIRGVGYYDLNDCTIKSEVVLNEKLELLDLHLEALKTKTVNFKKTENLSSCQFCPYKIICNV